MTDDETISLHRTMISGQRRADDYQVSWRGLAVGRFMRSSGASSRSIQWYWGCEFPGKHSEGASTGIGIDLKDCMAKFVIAWVRIRARLSHEDIMKAHRYAKSKRQRLVRTPKPRKPCRMSFREERAILAMAATAKAIDEIASKLNRRPETILRKAMELGVSLTPTGRCPR
jgi:hypothetical protein